MIPLMVVLCLASLLATAALADHSVPGTTATTPPPLYDDLGTWTHPVTTTSPEAQRYFDQGLRLTYGFNHDEATRAFREAVRLDPDCAMAWWGIALAAGPNINLAMDAEHASIAFETVARARALAGKASASERAYIEALSTRYSDASHITRAQLDSAYADAMRKLAKRYPNDHDAQALFAEALLDLNPWNQWQPDGTPNPGTNEIVAMLEAVLKKSPNHPGANHFYIHAMEASPRPERASASAKRLETLVPGAGHLVHMPSHIYARTGRYAESERANQRAVAADEKYFATQKPAGFYPTMYYPHNIHFIWFSACMEGRSAEALAAARKVAGYLSAETVRQMPMMEFVPPLPVLTLARFGRWDELLREPAPPVEQRYAIGIWHYARGLALASTGKPAGARAELDSVDAILAVIPADQSVSINFARPLLRIARSALAGEIALAEGRMEDALRELRVAVAAEDTLHYDEPPTWCYPVRQPLGAALLDAGRPKEAEAVYREDLERHPSNGWSLFGLAKALRSQGKTKEASVADADFLKAWSRSDVTLSASAY